jgi:hypothetical protein
MNSESTCCNKTSIAYVVGILGAFLIVALLVGKMREYMRPTDLGAARAGERSKNLAELHAAEADALHNPAWLDKEKGIVRLRIEDAMQLVERNWQNPSAARSNLIERVEKATFIPPPKPSAFE